MMDLLRALTRLHSQLIDDEPLLFPKTDAPGESLDLIAEHMTFYKQLMCGNISCLLQMIGLYCLERSADVGQDTAFYSRLAPFFLSTEIERRLAMEGAWLDYKAFSMNFNTSYRDMFGRYDDVVCQTDHIHQCVDTWMVLAMRDWEKRTPSAVFRRSLLLAFESDFMLHESVNRSGHSILIAIEYNGELMRLMVFDYRLQEYVFSVHDRLFQWMADGVGDRCRTINLTVCLKKRFHEYTEFMTCMSVAYRACVFLSFLRDVEKIAETDTDFANSSLFMQDRTFRMINWLCRNEDLISKARVVIVSRAMAENIFPLDSASCFLYLVPAELLVPVKPTPALLAAIPGSALPLGVDAETDALYKRLESRNVTKIHYNPDNDGAIFLVS